YLADKSESQSLSLTSLFSWSPDAVLIHGWGRSVMRRAVLESWVRGIPVVMRGDSNLLEPQSPLKSSAKFAALWSFFKLIDGFAVAGTLNRDFYVHYGVDSSRIFGAPFSVDNQYF